MSTQKPQKKYTSLSVELDTRAKLDKVMITLGKRMSYSEIINFLADAHLEEEEFVKHMLDNDMLD